MTDTLKLLSANGIGANKVVFTLVIDDEDEARMIRDDIKATLGGRPVGIKADIEDKTKESIDRVKVANVTPMDRVPGFERVTLTTHGRSVDITSETAQNAARMIRESLQ